MKFRDRSLFVLQCSVLILALYTSVPAAAVEVVLTSVKDNTLFEHQTAGVFLSNGAGTKLFFGRVSADQGYVLRRALVQFDFSSIPADAVVDSVEVEFETFGVAQNTTPFGGTANLHRVLASWGEESSFAPGGQGGGTVPAIGDVTWHHRLFDTTFWGSPGGDYHGTSSASYGYPAAPHVLTFAPTATLAADVQFWIRNPGQNFGWVLRGEEGLASSATAQWMNSREAGSGPYPQVTVNYSIPDVTDNLSLTELASGITDPIGIVNAGDGSNRLFILEQSGIVRIYQPGTGLLGTPFLNITAAVDDEENEQGLLGMAFHPDYPNTNAFYVNYTFGPAGNGSDSTRVAMYTVSGDPNIANTSETAIMEIDQDFWNHNGGEIRFGPDGNLYISTGDGGGSNDQYANGQDIDNLKGRILRINVDGNGTAPEACDEVGLQNYTVPVGNAFPGDGDGCDEILFFGLRNPWRFSFDALTGEMLIADVGQNTYEEINLAQPGESGTNFGWSCREGAHDFAGGSACISATVDPVLEYTHSGGNCSVTGGYVYRGSGTALQGRYVYGDWCSGDIWIATRSGSSWSAQEWTSVNVTTSSLASFGQDEKCELYLVRRTGGFLYRFDDSERFVQAGFEAKNCQ